ncbi:MAG: ribonuclease E/G, partial [Paracoccus sp. (in: a-proteobacteria)]|nr:ribonuclease E/G [Paracoccus sp. (in: a-proteobacteria)]
LRDLAGLIVIDFIDMDERKNNAAVEKRLKDRLKTDRARIQVGKISGFGLMEMSRQRLRPGMLESTTQPCAHCHGTGLIRSDDSLALTILRAIEEEGTRKRSREVLVRAPVAVANFLMNAKREHVAGIEVRYGLSVRVEADPALISPDFAIEKFKSATRIVPEPVSAALSVDAQLMAQIDDDETVIEDEADDSDHDDGDDAAPAENGERGESDGERGDGENGTRAKRRRRSRRRRGGKDRAEGENGNGDEAGTLSDDDGEADAGGDAVAAVVDRAAADADKPKSRSRSRTRSRRKPVDAGGNDTAAADAGAAAAEARTVEQADDAAVIAAEDAAPAPEAEGVAGQDAAGAADRQTADAAAAEEMAQSVERADAAAADAAEAEAPASEPVIAQGNGDGPADDAGDDAAPTAPAATAAAVPEDAAPAPASGDAPAPAPAKRRGWWSA